LGDHFWTSRTGVRSRNNSRGLERAAKLAHRGQVDLDKTARSRLGACLCGPGLVFAELEAHEL